MPYGLTSAQCKKMGQEMAEAMAGVMEKNINPSIHDRKTAVEISVACASAALTQLAFESAEAMTERELPIEEKEKLGIRIATILENFLTTHTNRR